MDCDNLPLLFTHVIGSLPRPKLVLDLLAQRDQLPADEYDARMDEMVIFAIRLQEQAGIDVVSDGEWRRTHYLGELFARVGGVEQVRPFEHQGETKYTTVFVRKMQAAEPVFARDARFLIKHARCHTKFALPSPFLIAIRNWHEDYSTGAYPTIQHLMEHLTRILAVEARALDEAGIDIIQLDDPALTYFCDRTLMQAGDSHDDRLKRQWDIDTQMPEAITCINQIAQGLRAKVHLHCCHSVYKRKSDVTGNYQPILPRLADAKIDRINLEFAYQGTGDISDLKLLPDHLNVGMGVLDVRSQRLQSVDEIESLAAAGAETIDPKRIALNPDCGFAPDAGEPPTIDEAYLKLKNLAQAAGRLRRRIQTKV
jgi:5-methyltetrahydropteroyltriglutamate--homocysteine methyltransferase